MVLNARTAFAQRTAPPFGLRRTARFPPASQRCPIRAPNFELFHSLKRTNGSSSEERREGKEEDATVNNNAPSFPPAEQALAAQTHLYILYRPFYRKNHPEPLRSTPLCAAQKIKSPPSRSARPSSPSLPSPPPMPTPTVDFSLFGGAETLPPSLSPPSSSSSDDDAPISYQGDKKLAGEEWAPHVVKPVQDHGDWLWLMTEEPHRSRRRAILKAHPEVSSVGGELGSARDGEEGGAGGWICIGSTGGGMGSGEDRSWPGACTSLLAPVRWCPMRFGGTAGRAARCGGTWGAYSDLGAEGWRVTASGG